MEGEPKRKVPRMFYIWKREMGNPWQLIESNEDEAYIKQREQELRSAQGGSRLGSWGTAYKITDYEMTGDELTK